MKDFYEQKCLMKCWRCEFEIAFVWRNIFEEFKEGEIILLYVETFNLGYGALLINKFIWRIKIFMQFFNFLIFIFLLLHLLLVFLPSSKSTAAYHNCFFEWLALIQGFFDESQWIWFDCEPFIKISNKCKIVETSVFDGYLFIYDIIIE